MAVRKIKTVLEIGGEKEYREALARANAELRNQKSALSLLAKEYDGQANREDVLRKKVDLLTKAKEAQNKVVSAAKDGLANAQVEYDRYTKQVEASAEKIAKANIRMEELKESIGDTTEEQEKLKQELAEYQQELDNYTSKQNLAGESVREWQKQQNTAETALNRLSTQLIQNRQYLDEAEKSTDHCANSIDEYGKKVRSASTDQKEFNEKSKRSQDAIYGIASALASAGIKRTVEEIANVLNACADAYTEFEVSLAKVGTIADTTVVPLDEMKRQILDLSNATGKSVNDLSESVYNAISASVDTARATEFVLQATKLATGGFTNETTAVDVLTTTINAYKLEISEAAKISDYLITTQNLGKTSVDELASSIGKVIPIAAAYNVRMDQLSTCYAVLTANGIATAETTTYLKAMLNELGDSGSTVSKVLTNETGYSFADLMKKGETLGDIMKVLGDSVGGNAGAFNELWSSSEAGIGALTLLNAGTEKYTEVLQQMESCTGATESAYQKMTDTAQMANDRMTNAFENLKITVGEQLKPSLEEVYSTGGDVLTWANEFIAKNEWLVPVLEAVAITLGAVAAGTAAVIAVTKILIPLIIELKGTLGAMTLISAAVGALIAAYITLRNIGEEAKEEWKQEVEQVRNLTEEIKNNTAAYQENRAAIEETQSNTAQMTQSLKDLLAIENKTETERAAILKIVEQLNDAIPGLNLKYDAEADAINYTTKELQKLADAEYARQQYATAQESWTEAYTRQAEAAEKLAEMQHKLADAQEEVAELQELQAAQTQELTSNAAELGRTYPQAWQDTGLKLAEAQEKANALTESVAALEQEMAASNGVMAAAQTQINLYAIETANLLPAQQTEIDAMMAEAEYLQGNAVLYAEKIAQIAEVAGAYDEYTTSLTSNLSQVMTSIDQLQQEYIESYNAAYENIQGQIDLFAEMQTTTDVTITGMINNLESQAEYLNQYAENIKKAMEYGIDEGLLEKLSDGSEESAKYLQAIVNDGGKHIGELNEQLSRVEEGKQIFADTVATMQTDYDEKMQEMVTLAEEAAAELDMYQQAYTSTTNTLQGAIDGAEDKKANVKGKFKEITAAEEGAVRELNQYNAAYSSAMNTMQGIIDGVNNRWDEVVKLHEQLGAAANAAYNRGQDAHSPSKKFEKSAQYSADGVIEGIKKNEQKVTEAYKKMASESVKTYKSEMDRLSDDIVPIRDAELSATSSLADASRTEQRSDNVKGILREMLNIQKENTASQTGESKTEINIYQPVKTPSEMMRAVRLEQQLKLAREI